MKNLIHFDWAVKRLLRNKANFVIVEGFLSELLGGDIKIESVLESEGNRQWADNKTNRVDILVQNALGELIIIEIQNDFMQDYLMRMVYGTSKLIVDNIDKGMSYDKVKKIISINIVYFDLGKGTDYIYRGRTIFWGVHDNDKLQLSATERQMYDTKEIADLYPEYYIIKVNQFNDVSKNTLDEWINLFKNQEVKADTKAKGLKEAEQELNMMKLSPEERAEYDQYIKDSRDKHGEIVGNYNKGKIEGRIERETELITELTIKMHKTGTPIAFIAKLLEISEDKINEIIKNIK